MAEEAVIIEEPETTAVEETSAEATTFATEERQETNATDGEPQEEPANDATQNAEQTAAADDAEIVIEAPQGEGEGSQEPQEGAAAEEGAADAPADGAQEGEAQEGAPEAAASSEAQGEAAPGDVDGDAIATDENAAQTAPDGDQPAEGAEAQEGQSAEPKSAEEGAVDDTDGTKAPEEGTEATGESAAGEAATGETTEGGEPQAPAEGEEAGRPKTPVGESLSRGGSPKPEAEKPPILTPDEPGATEERKRRPSRRGVGGYGYSFGGISEDDEADDYYDYDDEERERPPKKTKEQEEEEAAAAAAERVRQAREALVDEYHKVQQHREQIQTNNYQLQHKLADYFRKKKSEEAGRGIEFEKPSAEQDQRYAKYMASIEELRAEIIDQQNRYAAEIDMLRHRAEEQQKVIEEEFERFQQQQKEVGLKSVSQQTGRVMDEIELDQQLSMLSKKELEVTTMRLENIKMKNRLLKQEEELRSRDEIGEGLHMIDFEQLKIENQTYNEKIEERNEELTKLRKKITNTVQIMTHLKEKIQFLQNENERLKETLATVDGQVANSRDNLARTKHIRDSLRFENQRLRTSCGLLGHDELLRDFEIVVDDGTGQKNKLEKMKLEHTELSMLTAGLRRKIEQVNAGGAGGSKGIILPSIPLGQNSTVASQPSLFPQ